MESQGWSSSPSPSEDETPIPGRPPVSPPPPPQEGAPTTPPPGMRAARFSTSCFRLDRVGLSDGEEGKDAPEVEGQDGGGSGRSGSGTGRGGQNEGGPVGNVDPGMLSDEDDPFYTPAPNTDPGMDSEEDEAYLQYHGGNNDPVYSGVNTDPGMDSDEDQDNEDPRILPGDMYGPPGGYRDHGDMSDDYMMDGNLLGRLDDNTDPGSLPEDMYGSPRGHRGHGDMLDDDMRNDNLFGRLDDGTGDMDSYSSSDEDPSIKEYDIETGEAMPGGVPVYVESDASYGEANLNETVVVRSDSESSDSDSSEERPQDQKVTMNNSSDPQQSSGSNIPAQLNRSRNKDDDSDSSSTSSSSSSSSWKSEDSSEDSYDIGNLVGSIHGKKEDKNLSNIEEREEDSKNEEGTVSQSSEIINTSDIDLAVEEHISEGGESGAGVNAIGLMPDREMECSLPTPDLITPIFAESSHLPGVTPDTWSRDHPSYQSDDSPERDQGDLNQDPQPGTTSRPETPIDVDPDPFSVSYCSTSHPDSRDDLLATFDFGNVAFDAMHPDYSRQGSDEPAHKVVEEFFEKIEVESEKDDSSNSSHNGSDIDDVNDMQPISDVTGDSEKGSVQGKEEPDYSFSVMSSETMGEESGRWSTMDHHKQVEDFGEEDEERLEDNPRQSDDFGEDTGERFEDNPRQLDNFREDNEEKLEEKHRQFNDFREDNEEEIEDHPRQFDDFGEDAEERSQDNPRTNDGLGEDSEEKLGDKPRQCDDFGEDNEKELEDNPRQFNDFGEDTDERLKDNHGTFDDFGEDSEEKLGDKPRTFDDFGEDNIESFEDKLSVVGEEKLDGAIMDDSDGEPWEDDDNGGRQDMRSSFKATSGYLRSPDTLRKDGPMFPKQDTEQNVGIAREVNLQPNMEGVFEIGKLNTEDSDVVNEFGSEYVKVQLSEFAPTEDPTAEEEKEEEKEEKEEKGEKEGEKEEEEEEEEETGGWQCVFEDSTSCSDNNNDIVVTTTGSTGNTPRNDDLSEFLHKTSTQAGASQPFETGSSSSDHSGAGEPDQEDGDSITSFVMHERQILRQDTLDSQDEALENAFADSNDVPQGQDSDSSSNSESSKSSKSSESSKSSTSSKSDSSTSSDSFSSNKSHNGSSCTESNAEKDNEPLEDIPNVFSALPGVTLKAQRRAEDSSDVDSIRSDTTEEIQDDQSLATADDSSLEIERSLKLQEVDSETTNDEEWSTSSSTSSSSDPETTGRVTARRKGDSRRGSTQGNSRRGSTQDNSRRGSTQDNSRRGSTQGNSRRGSTQDKPGTDPRGYPIGDGIGRLEEGDSMEEMRSIEGHQPTVDEENDATIREAISRLKKRHSNEEMKEEQEEMEQEQEKEEQEKRKDEDGTGRPMEGDSINEMGSIERHQPTVEEQRNSTIREAISRLDERHFKEEENEKEEKEEDEKEKEEEKEQEQEEGEGQEEEEDEEEQKEGPKERYQVRPMRYPFERVLGRDVRELTPPSMGDITPPDRGEEKAEDIEKDIEVGEDMEMEVRERDEDREYREKDEMGKDREILDRERDTDIEDRENDADRVDKEGREGDEEIEDRERNEEIEEREKDEFSKDSRSSSLTEPSSDSVEEPTEKEGVYEEGHDSDDGRWEENKVPEKEEMHRERHGSSHWNGGKDRVHVQEEEEVYKESHDSDDESGKEEGVKVPYKESHGSDPWNGGADRVKVPDIDGVYRDRQDSDSWNGGEEGAKVPEEEGVNKERHDSESWNESEEEAKVPEKEGMYKERQGSDSWNGEEYGVKVPEIDGVYRESHDSGPWDRREEGMEEKEGVYKERSDSDDGSGEGVKVPEKEEVYMDRQESDPWNGVEDGIKVLEIDGVYRERQDSDDGSGSEEGVKVPDDLPEVDQIEPIDWPSQGETQNENIQEINREEEDPDEREEDPDGDTEDPDDDAEREESSENQDENVRPLSRAGAREEAFTNLKRGNHFGHLPEGQFEEDLINSDDGKESDETQNGDRLVVMYENIKNAALSDNAGSSRPARPLPTEWEDAMLQMTPERFEHLPGSSERVEHLSSTPERFERLPSASAHFELLSSTSEHVEPRFGKLFNTSSQQENQQPVEKQVTETSGDDIDDIFADVSDPSSTKSTKRKKSVTFENIFSDEESDEDVPPRPLTRAADNGDSSPENIFSDEEDAALFRDMTSKFLKQEPVRDTSQPSHDKETTDDSVSSSLELLPTKDTNDSISSASLRKSLRKYELTPSQPFTNDASISEDHGNHGDDDGDDDDDDIFPSFPRRVHHSDGSDDESSSPSIHQGPSRIRPTSGRPGQGRPNQGQPGQGRRTDVGIFPAFNGEVYNNRVMF